MLDWVYKKSSRKELTRVYLAQPSSSSTVCHLAWNLWRLAEVCKQNEPGAVNCSKEQESPLSPFSVHGVRGQKRGEGRFFFLISPLVAAACWLMAHFASKHFWYRNSRQTAGYLRKGKVKEDLICCHLQLILPVDPTHLVYYLYIFRHVDTFQHCSLFRYLSEQRKWMRHPKPWFAEKHPWEDREGAECGERVKLAAAACCCKTVHPSHMSIALQLWIQSKKGCSYYKFNILSGGCNVQLVSSILAITGFQGSLK